MNLKFFKDFIFNNREIMVVMFIMLALCMMVLPIPAYIMDFLIGFNIIISALTLMVVVYGGSILALTSFPTILLILAIFRIGITVSSSRLILLEAHAGKIVQTFGQFVVGGNIIVGAIIFLVITIINFIVIAKGSERVAEVAARFSLDSMPGKQMAVDNDLRAGNITMQEAQSRRRDIELESQFYGAMDGAMKFVKGDIIASMLDIFINIVGGIMIGTMQKGMTFAKSLETYSILTIGDGMVQQIPALLVSLTSGIIITKVNENSNQKTNIGVTVLKQLFSDYKAIFAASFLVLAMSFVPGMPILQFGIIFILLMVIAFSMKYKKLGFGKKQESDGVQEINEEELDISALGNLKLSPISLILADNLKRSSYIAKIKTALNQIQYLIAMELGIKLPNITIKYDSRNTPINNYTFLINEAPVAMAEIKHDELLVLNNKQAIYDAGVEINSENLKLPIYLHNGPSFWVNESAADTLSAFGINFLKPEAVIQRHLTSIMRSNVTEFLGMQEVKTIMDNNPDLQDLIKELFKMIPLNKITDVFQRLIAEDISIRNFKAILDALLEWSNKEKETIMLVEYVRQALGRYIVYKYTDVNTNIINCFLISYEIEDLVRDSIRYNQNGSYLALSQEDSTKFVAATRQMLSRFDAATSASMTIITQFDIRRYVRSIIEKDIPSLHVLSFQEIEKYVKIKNAGIIRI